MVRSCESAEQSVLAYKFFKGSRFTFLVVPARTLDRLVKFRVFAKAQKFSVLVLFSYGPLLVSILYEKLGWMLSNSPAI